MSPLRSPADTVVERFDVAALLARLGETPHRITADSRDVRPGDAFAAYPGTHADGRQFIPDALARGAGAVLWESPGYQWDAAWRVPNEAVDHLRERVGRIADFIFGSPSQALWMIGVTGTNGKTSCTHWIADGLAAAGRVPALLGTLGSGRPGLLAPARNTTPDAATLHESLAAMKREGVDAVAMEVSSHGLAQGRVNGVAFDVALFTNLSRDHLDYHRTMAEYGAAKARLFRWPGLSASIVNVDDPFGRDLVESLRAERRNVLGYGFGPADIAGSDLEVTADGVRFVASTPWGSARVVSDVVGAFNAWNLLGVLGVLLASDVPLEVAADALSRVRAPAGRMQRLGGSGQPLVVIDYAHSPDALEKALQALRPAVAEQRELVCVFGCGGDRDPGKRPLMGRVAAALADRVIVTDDNPRSEDPQQIAEAILHGIRETPNRHWALDLDRRAAIQRAIATARPGDVVLVAGKGHEAYQERHGVREPFSDVDVASEALRAWSAR
jgi:UDP-N-acetylmuramoyl-L-alanyl-D-glutamate--2,6-diaminopimelate ligase